MTFPVITLWNQTLETISRVGQTHLPLSYLVNRHVELALVATLFMAVVLLFMKYLGFCTALRHGRREMMACAYRILLYRRQPRLVLRTEARAIWCNGKYLILLLPTMVFASLLYLLMHEPLTNRYAFAPAPLGEPIAIRTTPLDSHRSLNEAMLHSSSASLPITARARIPGGADGGSIWLRLEPTEIGQWPLQLKGRSKAVVQFDAGAGAAPAMPMRVVDGISIHIAYPARLWWGMRRGWLIYFLLFSFLAALPLLPLLRVRL